MSDQEQYTIRVNKYDQYFDIEKTYDNCITNIIKYFDFDNVADICEKIILLDTELIKININGLSDIECIILLYCLCYLYEEKNGVLMKYICNTRPNLLNIEYVYIDCSCRYLETANILNFAHILIIDNLSSTN